MAWEITPQGYIKTVAKITKGAVLEYLGHEIGLTDSRVNKKIEVNRTIEELSKPETLKSFEGMPLTITHPDDKEVSADDWSQKSVGHIQNVRADGNYIICDAYIQDKNAIALLKDKDIRELSVGYEPADVQERGGKFYHENIRANHVAIVAEGRAGSDCRLQDSKQKRSGFAMKGIKGLLAFLKGKTLNDEGGAELTAEEIQELIASLELALSESEDEDAKKEFSLSAMTGFGADGSREEQKLDFDQVRGFFESNPFVEAVLEHIKIKGELGDELIARMSRMC